MRLALFAILACGCSLIHDYDEFKSVEDASVDTDGDTGLDASDSDAFVSDMRTTDMGGCRAPGVDCKAGGQCCSGLCDFEKCTGECPGPKPVACEVPAGMGKAMSCCDRLCPDNAGSIWAVACCLPENAVCPSGSTNFCCMGSCKMDSFGIRRCAP